MNRLDDWPRVKAILERALACPAAELPACLAEACGSDASLRAHVESLLAARHSAETFLETPAARLVDEQQPSEDLAGRTVSSYVLRSRLGAGGMGEVYLAHDAKLERPVALKFLSPDFAADSNRLRRFHQEARAASSLNHPHIVVVHDFGELDGRPYIVTELIEGETLRERLREGPLPARDVIDLGMQIAGALAAAHARGIVHRDVKPENVMVRPDGYAKVLDFGLAKLASGQAGVESRTRPGTVMGTPRYMSPEQVRGIDLDARSDVWSLGVLLYELLTGRQPFDGGTAADVVAAILGTDPRPLEELAPHTPPDLCGIVAKALQKERLDRYADAQELLVALRELPPAPLPSRGTSSGVGSAAGDEEALLPAAGERRRVTVFVSIVAGYGSLVERLAAPDVDHAIGRIRAAAVDIVRRHGGVVNQSIGEEIVSLFGIPTAHEDDDLRAVRAAMELHARAREIGAALDMRGVPLQLQSGVHAGSVVAQRLREGPRRFAVTGAPAQIAARLAAAAGADAILVTPECHRLLAPFVRTEPHPPLPVQAGAPPIRPFCVLGESGLESRLEAPARGGLTPYIGRTAQLNELEAQLDRARRGEGRFVTIIGEAGSGKSRMLHELRAKMAGVPFQVFTGRCRSYGGAASYLPFVEALHAGLGVKNQDQARSAVAQIVARIRAVEPSLEPFIPLYLHLLAMPSDVFPLPRHLRGEHFQAALFEALAAFFTSVVQQTPGLLILEDWHWADEASRLALDHLAGVVSACPLVIVMTTRPEPGGMDRTADALRIQLPPLEPAASQAMAKAVFGVEDLPDGLAERLHERTGGNPFFLEEMCQALREADVVAARGATAVILGSADALQLPDSVQAVIRSRLDRLDPAGREALRVASVIGREFTRGILRDVMGGADVMTALDALKNAGVIQQVKVVPEPVYRFKHVLTQEVAYESLLEHQRKALHLEAGRAIERSHGDSFGQPLEILVHHFSLAEAWDEAIAYGLQAAERATELSQFADALAMLERVQLWLTHVADEAVRRDRLAAVLLKQERLCETLGMRGRQLQLTTDLIALLAPHGASERLAETYLRQGDVSTLLKRFDAADRALATALRMSRDARDAALERNVLRSIGLLRWHQGRHAEALSITEHALAIDRERQDELAVAGDLSNLGNILKSMNENARALAILEEALTMPVVSSDPIKRAYILHIIATLHRAEGDNRQALSYLQEADDSARAHMLPIQRSFHLTSMAHIHLQEGRLAESLRLYNEAVELSRRARHAEGLSQSLRMLGEVLFALGREQEALPHLAEAAELFAQLEDRGSEAVMRQHLALVLERTVPSEAAAAWQRVRALAQAAGDARAELDALEGAARTMRRLSASPDAAVRAYGEALALASRLGDERRQAALRNTLGILHWEHGRYGEALSHYEAGLTLIRALGDRAREGLTLNSIGVTLSRLRRYEEARTALEDALAVNRTTGERLLEAHSLAALGEVAEALGRVDAALEYFEEALARRREIQDRRGEGWMLHHIARARGRSGDADGADAAARAAAVIAIECEDAALRQACGVADAGESAATPR